MDRLRERGEVLSEVRGVLDGTWEHPTGVLVVEGALGSGKTAMINSACHIARGLGMSVFKARATEAEAHESFTIVRHLLAQVIQDVDTNDRPPNRDTELAVRLVRSGGVLGVDTTDIFHSASALLMQAVRRPILLAVDDVHWADADSGACLHFLARWLDAGVMRLVVSTRPRRAGVPLTPADRLVSDPSTRVFSLQPLSSRVVGELVGDYLGARVDVAFATACHEITGGNPALVIALLHALEADEMSPTANSVARLEALSSPRVVRSVLERLSSAPEGAVALLEAVAVLGGRADLRVAAALANVEGDDASRIADVLADADLFRSGRPLEYIHPFVRSSVYGEIATARRSRAHAEAAQLLAASGPSAEVAVHLLQTEPNDDPWVVAELLAAARAALDRNDVPSTDQLLRRALAERPSGRQHAGVVQLRAELAASLGCAEAVELFRAAREGADAAEWAATGLTLVELLWNTPHASCIVDMLLAVRDDLAARGSDEQTRLGLIEFMIHRSTSPPIPVNTRLTSLLESGFTVATPVGRLASVFAAAAAAADPTSSKIDEVVEVVQSALTPAEVTSVSGVLATSVITQTLGVLVRGGRGDVADPILRAAKRAADERGDRSRSSELAIVLGDSLVVRGRLQEAEELVCDALSGAADLNSLTHDRALLLRVHILATRGEFDHAGELLAGVRVADWTGSGLCDRTVALETRGRLLLAAGRWSSALDDFAAASVLATQHGIVNPALTSWRVGMCEALSELGRDDEARTLADENLHLARQFGAPLQIAEGLRCCAQLAPVPERVSLLEEALEELDGTPAELERCRMLIDLGGATRAAGDPVGARRLLSQGADIAIRVGAGPMVELASDELRAAGARPRRLHLSGADALTPAELRVHELAARGDSNSTIAASLFVSVKTVESHLTHLYRKLGITSRAELAETLDVDSSAPTQLGGPHVSDTDGEGH